MITSEPYQLLITLTIVKLRPTLNKQYFVHKYIFLKVKRHFLEVGGLKMLDLNLHTIGILNISFYQKFSIVIEASTD